MGSIPMHFRQHFPKTAYAQKARFLSHPWYSRSVFSKVMIDASCPSIHFVYLSIASLYIYTPTELRTNIKSILESEIYRCVGLIRTFGKPVIANK